MLPALFAIACYISPNPSPLEWMVSGAKVDVERIEREVLATPGAKLVDRASGERLAFARFSVSPSMLYGDYMGIMNVAALSGALISPPALQIPSCAVAGRAEDIDNPHAPVLVGLFGDASSVARVRQQNPWARFFDFALADGRRGVGFEPTTAQATRYEEFLAAAGAGKFASVEIVMLTRRSTGSP